MSKKKKKLSFVMGLIVVLAVLGALYMAYDKGLIKFEKANSKSDNTKTNTNTDNDDDEVETSKYKIIDTTSDARPYAVMIDNVNGARPQSGLQSAYMVYEITVEAGLTRLMALFKDADLSMIGPVRSSRHYFLDYVLENDAIYVHHGWSDYAQSDISALGINNLNGLANPSNMFWREKTKVSPHNSFTNSAKMEKAASNKKYRLTSTNYQVLNYSATAVDLSSTKYASSESATDVVIKYSGNTKVSYTYDATNKVYLRFHNGAKHIDYLTNKQLTVKNIIILNGITVDVISGDSKGRINLGNIGTGSGYYISEGEAIKITWEKTSRSAKTVYKDENNEVLKINDGNTFVQIQPSGQVPVIS